MEVIGFRTVNFKGADGSTISGRNIFVVYEDENVTGKACEKIFLSDSRFGSEVIQVGDQLDVRYNRYGKVDRIEVII